MSEVSDTPMPIAMRQPRQCRGTGWFYINAATIDVFVQPGKNCATLTRAQLLGALKVMDAAAAPEQGR